MTPAGGELTPERWARVKVVFERALECRPEERAPYLDRACAGDAALRSEVGSLLAAHDDSESFLGTPAVALGGEAFAAPAAPVSVVASGGVVGRYRVIGLLGAGGMGQVYLAEDPALGRMVALKLLPRSLNADPDRLGRFRQEARAASALSHPNVCVIYEVSETAVADGERRYLAMEYVPGESLRDAMERHRAAGTRLPLGTALDVAEQVARGLGAAHAAGVVHRDVKPENVMVRPDGLVKVLDFGLAKLAGRGDDAPAADGGRSVHTEPGMVLGTVRYMSPEQARGLPVDGRTDVWSLGVVLYEMLTGRPPFDGETATDVMVAVIDREPPALGTAVPGLDPDLHAIVARALRKDRAARTASMEALAAELAAVRGGVAPNAASDDRARPSARPAPATRRRAAVIAAGAAAAGVVALVGIVLARRPPAPAQPRARTVAVTTFDNASGVPALAVTGRLLADYFGSAVGGVNGVTVADRDETVRAERSAPAAGADSTRLTVARRTHATLFVSGAFYAIGDSLQVDVRLVDGANGVVIRTLRPVRVPRADPTRGLETLRDRVLGGIALLTDSTFGPGMLPRGDPPTYAAYLAVREGLEIQAALRPPDAGEAEGGSDARRFARAAEADTTYLQAWLWLASALLRRPGGEAGADSILTAVAERGERLSPFESAMADALRADVSGNHELSARGWRRAATLAGAWPPRWWLASKLRDANRPREALVVYDSLGAWRPHFYRAVPSIRHYLGDYRAEWAVLTAEAARTPSAVQTLDYQQAALQALAALDSVGAVLRAVDAVTSLPAEGGTSVAYLLTRTAWELGAHGHRDAAQVLSGRAVAWCGRRGARELRNRLLRDDCLEVYAGAAPWGEARRALEAALRADPANLTLLGLLGVAAAAAGDRGMADSVAVAVEARARDDGSRGLPEWIRARIAGTLGDRDAAVALLRDAFARGTTWGARLDLHRDPAFDRLRGYPPFEQLKRPQA